MRQLAAWHRTIAGLLTFGAIELALAYAFASLAIDRGSWWWYALTLLFLTGALRNVVLLIRTLINHRGNVDMRLRVRWRIILGVVVFAGVFVPLNSYWQNIETTHAIVLDHNDALCGGINIPYGVDVDQYLSQYALPARGFPFTIQRGGVCVPEPSQRIELLDGVVAACVALAAAFLTVFTVWKLLLHATRQQHV